MIRNESKSENPALSIDGAALLLRCASMVAAFEASGQTLFFALK